MHKPAVKPLMVVSLLYVTMIIIGNITAVKLIEVGPLIVPASIVIFPLTFVFDDLLTEVYGYSQARIIIWLALICNVIGVILIQLTIVLPYPTAWHDQSAYTTIFSAVPRIMFASFIAVPAGQFVNSYVLAKLKVWWLG